MTVPAVPTERGAHVQTEVTTQAWLISEVCWGWGWGWAFPPTGKRGTVNPRAALNFFSLMTMRPNIMYQRNRLQRNRLRQCQMVFVGALVAVKKNRCLIAQQGCGKTPLQVFFPQLVSGNVTDRTKMRNEEILRSKQRRPRGSGVYSCIFSKQFWNRSWLFQQLHFYEDDSIQMIPFFRSCLPKCDRTSKEHVSTNTQELAAARTNPSIYRH